jgi:hypothetical protein
MPLSMRFEAFLDPMDNWVVWDCKEQYFAEVGTRYLQSLPEGQAKAFCIILNILLSKNDAGEPTSVRRHRYGRKNPPGVNRRASKLFGRVDQAAN